MQYPCHFPLQRAAFKAFLTKYAAIYPPSPKNFFSLYRFLHAEKWEGPVPLARTIKTSPAVEGYAQERARA
jgi:hypothetical protein